MKHIRLILILLAIVSLVACSLPVRIVIESAHGVWLIREYAEER